MFDSLMPLIFGNAYTAEERVFCLLLFVFFLDLFASLLKIAMGGARDRW